MFKKFLLVGFLLISPMAFAQEAYWSFDDEGREMIIPPECDETFDADELYEIGMRLLDETGYVKQGAAYCLLASAFAGNANAQYQVAEMYHKGISMPKSDLAAYKWATLAALNGSEEADRLGAGIEQFLSIQDIELSTNSLGSMIGTMKSTKEAELAQTQATYDELKERLKTLKKEVSDLEMFGKILPAQKAKATSAQKGTTKPALSTTAQNTTPKPSLTSLKKPEPRTERARPNEPIFNKADLDAAPMPTY